MEGKKTRREGERDREEECTSYARHATPPRQQLLLFHCFHGNGGGGMLLRAQSSEGTAMNGVGEGAGQERGERRGDASCVCVLGK